MFQEDLAKYTADHLRTHIEAYLEAVNARFTGAKKISLIVPKTIEVASVVGGTISEFQKLLPMYGIDVLNISEAQDSAALYTHEYDGQINGLISSSSRDIADGLIKRHANAVERYVRDHLFLHELKNDYFTVVNFQAGNLEFSGAEDLGEVEGKQIWLAAFSLNVVWFTSEDGPIQHA